ncbi:MAG: hypothetical protein F6K22_30980 [Okeania sp. SIO2F4]|uniref:hypothetical protein n=1 Tax=Okeania sp. SIO2F4 TaxID=2607790 RepID=UPI00142CC3D0|nr:hypothetical protein [Okeania sp. SIO2F4]NES06852.1 hypothetical protein [Okeania sp. SIO2F4]
MLDNLLLNNLRPEEIVKYLEKIKLKITVGSKFFQTILNYDSRYLTRPNLKLTLFLTKYLGELLKR